MTVGMRVAQIIADQNLSQKEMADKLGISVSTMSRIVNGTQELNRAAKLILADRFGVNIDWLETGNGSPYLISSKEEPGIADTLIEVLRDNPAILRLVTEVSARMTAADWRKLNDFIDSLGGTK